MTTDDVRRLSRVEAAFHAALERREGEEREIFVAATCATDPDIAQELRQLLTSYSQIEEDAVSAVDVLPRFGAWQATRLLGSGGMGTVYLAERADGMFQMRAAVKAAPLALASPAIEERFRRERQFLAVLDYPGISRLIDGGVSDSGLPYLVMDFVDGEPIDAYAQRLNLDERARLGLMLQMLDALQYVHQQRVLHRDLKPSNVLVDSAGRVKLLDFGIAHLMEADADPNVARSLVLTFTPDYASPEQLRGEPLTESSDIYSAGVLLAKLLTGELPGPDLSAVIAKATNKDPFSRYLSAADMSADLQRYLSGRPTTARIRKLSLLAGAAIAASLVLAALVVLYLRQRSASADLSVLDAAEIESPALSANGQWLAYVFQSHIWVRETSKSKARQVTFKPGIDAHPALSSHGETLVYEHRGGASAAPAPAILYKVQLRNGHPAAQEQRLFEGFRPKISPDGQKIAFETIPLSGADNATPREIQVVSLVDRSPVPVPVQQPAILDNWTWAADSQSLVALGDASYPQLFKLGLHGEAPLGLDFWPANYNDPSFCGVNGTRVVAIATYLRIWRWVEIALRGGNTHEVRSPFQGHAPCQALNDGRIAIFEDSSQRHIWELPGDVAPGNFRSVDAHTTGIVADSFLSASADGRWVTWFNKEQAVLRDPVGHAIGLPANVQWPSVSPDGAVLAVKEFAMQGPFRLLSLPERRPLAEFTVDSLLWDVSKQGRRVLCVGIPRVPRSIAVMNTSTGLLRTVLMDPKRDLYLASFSPDEHWIVFTAEGLNDQSHIYVARFDDSRVTPPSEWIELTRGDYPKWGPSGDRIYYLASDSRSILTLPLDPATKRPVIGSQPQTVFTFPAPWSTRGLLPGTFRIAVTKDRLFFLLGKPRISVKIIGRKPYSH